MNNMTQDNTQAYAKGKITVQLHNAKTGKLEHEQHIENFVARPALRRLEWQIRQNYVTDITTIGGTYSDPTPKSPFGAIVLTDSTLTEDPANEWSMPGKLIGYALRAAYAGTDTLRGTPSITELDAQETYSKWVYLWPDIAANGTIGSVGFSGYEAFGTEVIPTAPRSIFSLSASVEQTWPTTSNWTYFARSSTMSFAHPGNNSTSITRLDTDYAPTLASFDVFPYVKVVRGLAWDPTGEFLWVIGEADANKVIAKFNSSGVLQEGPYNTTNRNHRYLAFDGTNLWSATQSGATVTFWCINPANGNDINNFTHETYRTSSGDYYSQMVCGLCWEPTFQRLWVRYTMYSHGGAGAQYNKATIQGFNVSGEQDTPEISLRAYNFNTGGTAALYHYSISADFDYIDGTQFAVPYSTAVYRFRPDSMATRAKLSPAVTKNNTQTLKVVYQVDYSE